MKFIVVPILCLLVLAQTFSKWLIVLEYKLNKDYITKNLCINRDIPKLHCNGKCQLMRKLAEEEKQNAPANTGNQTKETEQNVLFSQIIIIPSIASPGIEEKRYNTEYILSDYTSPPISIFRPPALA
jgi:hypothetical protein